MTAVVVDIECMNKNIVKEIGIYHTGYCIGIALLPPEEKAKLSDSDQTFLVDQTFSLHVMG